MLLNNVTVYSLQMYRVNSLFSVLFFCIFCHVLSLMLNFFLQYINNFVIKSEDKVFRFTHLINQYSFNKLEDFKPVLKSRSDIL